MGSPWIEACERELIHAPDTTQSWGALLIAGEDDLRLRYASANLDQLLGVTAADALGRGLNDVLDPATMAGAVAGATSDMPSRHFPIQGRRRGTSAGLTASCHRLNGCVYLEIEPVQREGAPATWPEARMVVQALRSAGTLASLYAIAVSQLRQATGFDRAMVYRFDPAGHGEIVAEDCAPDMESLVGLRYPASDVPRQARRLYLRQRVRVIGDVSAPAVPLLAAKSGLASPDLSLCTLRAISPVHLAYMRNMGVQASVAVSLAVDGALWGMLVCHHRERRHVGPGTRALADLIGQVASLMVGTLRDAEARAEMARTRLRVSGLAGKLATHQGGAAQLPALLEEDGRALMALCDASGAIVRLGGAMASLGTAPQGVAAGRLLDRLLEAAPEGGDAFATQALAEVLPDDQAVLGGAAGALLLKLIHAPGDGIAWLRPEQASTLRWGGDPSRPAEIDPATGALSPRRSFGVWKEEVRGRSAAWTTTQIEAAHAFRREIDRVLVRCAEQELSRLRAHDALTGLPNRRMLREWLAEMAGSQAGAHLLLIEIDRLKTLGDAVGEELIDAVLVETAERIVSIATLLGGRVARSDTSVFGVLCHDIDQGEAVQFGELLRAAVAAPFKAGGKPIRVTASLGLAPAMAVGPDGCMDMLIAHADSALQAAKTEGGNRVLVFRSALHEGAGRRMEIEQELRALLSGERERAGEFRLLYQPCVSLSGWRPDGGLDSQAASRPPLRGFEALLRWRHPRLGNVQPDEFIGIAEECGLIGAVGEWVIQTAIDQLADWRPVAGGLAQEVWRVAVNVSPHQLRRADFAADLFGKLACRDLPPHCLTIEVTEGVFTDSAATSVLAELRKAGIKISVDDFGIGYSSLSYLRRLPADELKLDRTFLQRNDGGPLHEDMLGALVQLARAVGLSVLAEGVETDAHLTAVAAAGCDAAQGWLFAKALPADEAAAWIETCSAVAVAAPAARRIPFSFRDIVEAANEAVLVTTADMDAPGPGIVYVNPAFTRMTGWALGDVLGRSPRLLQGPKSDRKTLSDLAQALREGRSAHARVMNYARSGMSYWCEIRAAPLRNQHGEITHFVAIERDVSHEMRRLDDLETLVERDPLTGMANRRGLDRFVAGLSAEDRVSFCVAYIDIDGFKAINDRLGHAVGDAVLMGLTDVTCQNIRRMDFVGRIGGDEFVVCMPGCRLPDAQMVAERLQRAIAEHAFETPAGLVRANCSIGVAGGRLDACGLADVIARANAALYQAKSAGKGAVVLGGALD